MDIKGKIIAEINRTKEGIDRKELLRFINAELWIYQEDSISDRKFRRLIKEMIIEDGYPIGSSPARGYFIVRNQQDLNEATKELHSKSMSMLYREKKLKENAVKFSGTQLQLPGMDEVADFVKGEIQKEIAKG